MKVVELVGGMHERGEGGWLREEENVGGLKFSDW